MVTLPESTRTSTSGPPPRRLPSRAPRDGSRVGVTLCRAPRRRATAAAGTAPVTIIVCASIPPRSTASATRAQPPHLGSGRGSHEWPRGRAGSTRLLVRLETAGAAPISAARRLELGLSPLCVACARKNGLKTWFLRKRKTPVKSDINRLFTLRGGSCALWSTPNKASLAEPSGLFARSRVRT
jgi:hypothetical protein